MNRVKSFDATGVAPNGRLYAGDLNAIQDAAAALMDLAQVLGVGTIEVGESGLQIVRFGAGDLRITGAARTDGILRGLGGLYSGQFTTAQRDAIAVGSRPYGLIIFNTTTNRYEWNQGTDAVPNWQPIGPSEATIIADAHLTGTLAARPAANTVNPGVLYFAYDNGLVYRSDGAAWSLLAARAGARYDYAQITANAGSTSATHTAIITGNAVAFDGATQVFVRVWAFAAYMAATGTNTGGMEIMEDGATVIAQYDHAVVQPPAVGTRFGYVMNIRRTPAAGNHTYSVRTWSDGTNPNTVYAGSGGSGSLPPAYLEVVAS